MSTVEQEQLKQKVEQYVAQLKRGLRNGTYPDTDENLQLIEIYNEYVQSGASLMELKLFYDDLCIALDEGCLC